MNELHQRYQEIQDQIKALQDEAETLKGEAKRNAVATVNQLIATYALTSGDIDLPKQKEAPRPRPPRVRPGSSSKPPRPPVFRDPVTGATWTGQGGTPKWMEGQDRELFRIQKTAEPLVPPTPDVTQATGTGLPPAFFSRTHLVSDVEPDQAPE